MADDQRDGGIGGLRPRSWAEPVREIVSRVLGSDSAGGDAPPSQPDRTTSCVVDCAVYVDGVRQPGALDYPKALDAAQSTGGFVWLGLHEPTEADFTQVAHAFGLDELAAEHAIVPQHRPAVERSEQLAVMVLRTTRYVEHPELTETSEVVETGAVVVFVGPQLRDHRAARRTRRVGAGPRRPGGPAAAAGAGAVGGRPRGVRPARRHVRGGGGGGGGRYRRGRRTCVLPRRWPGGRVAHIYQLKRELMEFKRAVAPLQRPLAALLDDREALPKAVRRYLRDVHGDLLRTVEQIAAFDELLNSILQARLAQVTVDQNNDLRKIAGWAAIFAVQTFIAGIYGMNFEYMPELKWTYGYAIVLVGHARHLGRHVPRLPPQQLDVGILPVTRRCSSGRRRMKSRLSGR